MTELSPLAIGAFLACVAISSLAGIFLSSALPWAAQVRTIGLVVATGAALGPFILGLAAVLVTGLLPGASHELHLVVVCCGVVATFGILTCFGQHRLLRQRRLHLLVQQGFIAFSPLEWLLLALLVVTACALVILATFTPLVQNDALEYALTARELYLTRDLYSYPVLNPTTNASGFYGPWTHPPLYVALLYIANIIQGNADAPGLIRLISPWFTLCGAWLIYAVSVSINRITGLLASLFFLSPPLFFLGASSALLDPLPVLGLMLIMAVGVGLNARPAVYGAVVGGMLGLALWTHSQAVLFAPLALTMTIAHWGLRNSKSWISATASLFFVAALTGVWPYLHNMQVLGVAVSDNPTVFALPGLHWDDYFTVGRGLGNVTALVQYGVLKAWFVPESYGFVFWGLLIGFVFFIRSEQYMTPDTYIGKGMADAAPQRKLLWLAAGLFVAYLLGMLVSATLGINHLLKNERYLLMTLPAAALLCAHGCDRLAQTLAHYFQPLRFLFFALIAIYYVAHMSIIVKYNISKSGQGGPFGLSAPEIQLIETMNKDEASGNVVLSLKPAAMYYSSHRMISFLDERLLPLYAQEESDAAYQELKNLAVSHIYVPNYGVPPLYNSRIFALLRDPDYTTLLHQNEAGQIYLLKPDQTVLTSSMNISPDEKSWSIQRGFSLGGKKNLAGIWRYRAALEGSAYQTKLPFDLFHRHWYTIAKVGVDIPTMLPTADTALPVDSASEYAIDLHLAGKGLVEISIEQYSRKEDSGKYMLIKNTEIVSFELSDRQPARDYAFRFFTDSASQAIALNIKSMGSSEIHIEKATLGHYQRPTDF